MLSAICSSLAAVSFRFLHRSCASAWGSFSRSVTLILSPVGSGSTAATAAASCTATDAATTAATAAEVCLAVMPKR